MHLLKLTPYSTLQKKKKIFSKLSIHKEHHLHNIKKKIFSKLSIYKEHHVHNITNILVYLFKDCKVGEHKRFHFFNFQIFPAREVTEISLAWKKKENKSYGKL